MGRELEELLTNGLAMVSASVDGRMVAFSDKIDQKIAEIFETIRLATTNGAFGGSASHNCEERQSTPNLDTGQRNRIQSAPPDGLRYRFGTLANPSSA